jgi:hypothetical protein
LTTATPVNNPLVKLDQDQFSALLASLQNLSTKIQKLETAVSDLPGRKAEVNVTGELDGVPVEFVGAYDVNNLAPVAVRVVQPTTAAEQDLHSTSEKTCWPWK